MASKSTIEDRLAELASLDLSHADAVQRLRAALAEKSALVVAKAAQLVRKTPFDSLERELHEAFSRFIAKPDADKGCRAKLAIAQTLYELGVVAEELYLTGVRHVQLEPAFGGPADTAALLRGTCALGLVRMGSRHALECLAELIMDPELQARQMAARAIAYAGREEGMLILRTKLLAGDSDMSVMAECFSAMLQLGGERGLKFVAKFMQDKREDVAQEAAIAIGSSRQEGAFTCLRELWERDMRANTRLRLLGPLSLCRRPEANEILLGVIENSPEEMACAAIEAMGIYRRDEQLARRIKEAAGERSRAIQAAYARTFGG